VKKSNLVKSQDGAIVVEAAFVLPVVIVVIFILIYMALIQIQEGVMYMQAQRMSQKICSLTTFPGYELFYEDAYEYSSSYLELPPDYLPPLGLLDSIYETHNPYRYIGGNYFDKFNNYEKEISEIIKRSSYFNGGTAHASIDTKFSNLSTSVVVLLTYDYELPKFVRILGLDTSIAIQAQAVTYANDTVDFIRNTDLTFDLFDYLLKRYQLKDKINVFYEKIKHVSEKLF